MPGGLPHSEIPGSTIARISPGLFAACHVLHRLSVPRHPPDALQSRSITRHPAPQDHPEGSPAAQRAPGKPPRTGASPTVVQTEGQPRRGRSHEDTFSDDAPHTGSHPRPRPVRLGHIHKSSSPFNQHRLRGPARDFPRGKPRSTAAAPNFASPNRRTSQPNPPAKPPRPPQGAAAHDGGAAHGGGERDRTDDLLLAKQALSQLSYTPVPEDRSSEIRNAEFLPFGFLLFCHLDGGPGRI